MASIFDQTITPELKFSNFPLNEWQLVSQNFGQLVPVYVREVLPNDVFTLSAFVNVDFAPMVAPMYQEVNVSVHFFYCPERTLWDDFETFITGSEEGHVIDEDKLPVGRGLPKSYFYELADQAAIANFQGTIFDYIGLPNNLNAYTTETEIVDDSPYRAYFKIWYDYYRDENLQVEFAYTDKNAQTQKLSYFDFWRSWRRNSNIVDVLDEDYNADNASEALATGLNGFMPFYRAFKKDYFTAALPTPQKGEEVKLSLGDTAPVLLDRLELTKSSNVGDLGPQFKWSDTLGPGEAVKTGHLISPTTDRTNIRTDYSEVTLESIIATPLSAQRLTDRQIVGRADLSQMRAITVEALREAFAVQEILESLSVRGSRFTEFLRGNFGVTPDDARLQRPQFIGGIVAPVAVQKVVQTSGYSGDDSRDMTGYQAGRAYATAGERVFRMRFKEHGWILGIASVMPKAYYYQGIPRHFLRHDRFDYYLPQTAHLGEQGIENQELYYSPNSADNKKIFGYIPRWAEYKTSTNGIHGDFRGSLNYYHMARVFGAMPTLSEAFISTANLQTRPFAVWQSENPNINHLIWAQYYFKVTGSRPMPYYSLPKIH